MALFLSSESGLGMSVKPVLMHRVIPSFKVREFLPLSTSALSRVSMPMPAPTLRTKCFSRSGFLDLSRLRALL